MQVYGQTPTGTTTRLYVLSSGRFITEDNCAAIQARLYTALVGLAIRKGTFTIVCNPNVKPGQIVQVTVPQAGSNITMTIPITSVTIKGSLKATYTSEAVSADEADDLRKPDTVTQEDLEKAIEDISGGGGGVVVHFPKVVMDCWDPTHWYTTEAPCNPGGSGYGGGVSAKLSISSNNRVFTGYSNQGYDFNSITWAKSDALIPPYDANNNNPFDVTLYLCSYNMDSGELPGFDAYDSLNDQYYLYPLHTLAKYSSQNVLRFEQQWVWGPVFGVYPNQLGAGVLIPLPSLKFNIETKQWILPTPQSAPSETYYAPIRYL